MVQSARMTASRTVRHFLADFASLEERYPGAYPRMITRGEGAYLFDDQDRKLLDAGNHLGAGMIGHGREEVAERIAGQIGRLEFAALDSGKSHDRVAELASRLAAVVPLDDPSSPSPRAAARPTTSPSSWRALPRRHGEPGRDRILFRDGSYHGATIAAMSATGAAAFQAGFGPLAPRFTQVPQPSPSRCGFCDRGGAARCACAEALEEAIEREGPETIAAVIAEPVAILQAVKVPHAAVLAARRVDLRRARHPADRRRGGDRVRPNGPHVRLRALGRSAGHHDHRQGPDERIRPDGRDDRRPHVEDAFATRRCCTSTRTRAIRWPARRRWRRSTSSSASACRAGRGAGAVLRAGSRQLGERSGRLASRRRDRPSQQRRAGRIGPRATPRLS